MLKLKKEFEGKVVTLNLMKVGLITFDANKVKPTEYEKYQLLGFDIFEYVADYKQPIRYTGIIDSNEGSIGYTISDKGVEMEPLKTKKNDKKTRTKKPSKSKEA